MTLRREFHKTDNAICHVIVKRNKLLLEMQNREGSSKVTRVTSQSHIGEGTPKPLEHNQKHSDLNSKTNG